MENANQLEESDNENELEETESSTNNESGEKGFSKKVTETIPILSLFVIFIGFLKLSTFYQYYNINILDYLDASEIILSFLDDLSIIVLLIFVLLYYSIWLMKKFDNQSGNGKMDEMPAWLEDAIKNFREIRDKLFKASIWTVLVSGLCFYLFTNLFWLCVLFLYCFQFLILFFERIMIGKEQEFRNPKFVFGISLVISFLLFTVGIAYRDVNSLKYDNEFKVEILTDNGLIQTNKDYQNIGQTSKYVFLYCYSENKTEIIKRDNIKRMDIIENENNNLEEIIFKLNSKTGINFNHLCY